MGAWGAGVFENDDALDWLGCLVAGKDTAAIVEALDEFAALSPDAYIQADTASNALAAVEALAAMLGKPMSRAPESMEGWAAQGHAVDRRLVDAALHAIERIGTKSELRDLWNDAGLDDWIAVLRELEGRLR